MKVLVVEDQEELRESIVDLLNDEHYVVDTAEDGEEGLYKALNWDYDCILLDIMMPKMHGYEVLQALRKEKATPVLILTARDALEDKVFGLDNGADDFLVKPFEVDELLARIRSIRRRSAREVAPIHQAAGVTIDLNRKEVSQGEKLVDLTGKEYAFVELMFHQKGKVVTREYLYEHLFDEEDESLSNLLDVYIYKLRKKLGKDFIKTKRGQGYLLE